MRRARGEAVAPRAYLRASILLTIVSAVSCAPRLMKLPTAPGTPIASGEADRTLNEATMQCAAVRTLTAEVAVRGSVAGRRIGARLSAGVADPASVRLEAVAPFGPPFFIFVARQDDATLLLPRDERLLQHGRPETVLDAVAGVPLGAADLKLTLTSCAERVAARQGRQVGEDWRVVSTGEAEWYLRREASAWRLVAVQHRQTDRAWRTEFADPRDGIARSIRVSSIDAGGDTGRAFDLRLTLTQVETNVDLGPDVFRVQIPPDARAITLDEIRRARPGIRED